MSLAVWSYVVVDVVTSASLPPPWLCVIEAAKFVHTAFIACPSSLEVGSAGYVAAIHWLKRQPQLPGLWRGDGTLACDLLSVLAVFEHAAPPSHSGPLGRTAASSVPRPAGATQPKRRGRPHKRLLNGRPPAEAEEGQRANRSGASGEPPTKKSCVPPTTPSSTPACTCVHSQSRACDSATALTFRYPVLCKLAAAASVPHEVFRILPNSMWAVLESVIAVHGLFQVRVL